jgi:hypothetical protein
MTHKPPYRCRTCVFFYVASSDPEVIEGGIMGSCRRYPPGVTGGAFHNCEWPDVHSTNWCGEHKPETGA